MSLALIRSDLLTDIANQGESAASAIAQSAREFLEDSPGPWLPEQFYSPYELIDRSLRNSTKVGKQALLSFLHQELRSLFRHFCTFKLDEKESRRLLAILALAKSHRALCTDELTILVFVAMNVENLFWSKVKQAPDIVGTKANDRAEFISFLWSKIPKSQRDRVEELQETAIEVISTSGNSQSVHFCEPLIVTIESGERTYEKGLMMVSDRVPIVYAKEQIPETKNRLLPRVHLGTVRLHDTTSATLCNAIPSRWQMARPSLIAF